MVKDKFKSIKARFPQGFFDHRNKENLSNDEYMVRLFTCFQRYKDLFTLQEIDSIQEAARITDTDFHTLVRKAVLIAVKSIKKPSTCKKEKTIHLYTQQANDRLENVINQMIAYNDSCSGWYDKVYITPYSIKNYVVAHQNELGFRILNQSVLTRCMDVYGDLIHAHHKKHQMETDHNRKAHFHKKMLEDKNDCV